MWYIMFRKLSTLIVAINVIFISHAAQAGLIANGDFDNGLNSWSDASFSGQVFSNNGLVNLSTGVGFGPYSAVLVQGDDGFFNFNTPILIDAQQSLIEFDLWQFERNIDASESGTSSLADVLNLSIYDAFDPSFDLFFHRFSGNFTTKKLFFRYF